MNVMIKQAHLKGDSASMTLRWPEYRINAIKHLHSEKICKNRAKCVNMKEFSVCIGTIWEAAACEYCWSTVFLCRFTLLIIRDSKKKKKSCVLDKR